MFTQFFGNYLLNKGLVSSAQLSRALSDQKNTRAKLGVLAINAGFMTAQQVDEVHAEQQRVDMRMGDLAVKMGYLTNEQVDMLLSQQGMAHLALGQTLIESGVMTNSEFADALNNYKAENSLTDIDFADKTGNKINEIIAHFFNFEGEPQKDLLTEYVTLLFKNIIRFIGDDFTPLSPEKIPSTRSSFSAIQKTEGAFVSTTIFDAAESAYISFASRYAGETLTDADEMADAANGEFLNLHNGLFTVNVSNERSQEIKLLPQEFQKGGTIQGPAYRIALVFPFGTVCFYIAV